MRRPGVEPATCWLQVQRPNHYTTEPHINWPVAQPSSRPRHKGVFEALKRPQCARLWLCLTATEEDLRAVGPVLQRQRTAAHGCSQRNRKCRRRVTWQGARSAGRHRRKHRLRADRDTGTDRVQNTRASVSQPLIRVAGWHNSQCSCTAAAQLYAHLPSRCWTNRSPGQTFPGVLSGFQQRLCGTRCYKQFWSATLCLYLNRLKTFFDSLRLSPNTNSICSQRLWSYDRMAPYKFDYYYYYYIAR